MFNALPSMLPHIQAGKIRRSARPDRSAPPASRYVPTIKDAVPGYEVVTWYSFVAPAGTPKAVIEQAQPRDLRDRRVAADEGEAQGAGPRGRCMKPEELAKLYRDETAKWAKVIKDSKITPE
jgi:tripartite-type tricarboxylate transporter receptor subunit TctC